MPTIVVASPKGGAGKSTTAVLLGTELAHENVPVTMLDCDPNRSLTLWASQSDVPAGITVLSDITEAEIVRTIKAHDNDGQVVIVDLEGVASRLVSRAISQADLVLTPMRATTLDATIGARALQLIADGMRRDMLSKRDHLTRRQRSHCFAQPGGVSVNEQSPCVCRAEKQTVDGVERRHIRKGGQVLTRAKVGKLNAGFAACTSAAANLGHQP